MFTGLLSVRRPSVPPPVNSYFASRDISVLSGWISMKLCTTNSSCEWKLLKSLSKSEVKGQVHSDVKCTFPADKYPSSYGRPSVVPSGGGIPIHAVDCSDDLFYILPSWRRKVYIKREL